MILLACWIPAICVVQAEGYPSDLVSPGWLASDLMVDGVRMGGYSKTVSDGTRVFALLHNGNIARINPALGTVDVLQGSGRFMGGYYEMNLDGDYILFSSSNREFENSSDVDNIHIDVLDLVSGTWRERKTVTVPGSAFGRTKASVYKDELRVTLELGKILRWKASDMTQLPTLSIPPGQFAFSNKLTAICATSVGSEFCAGITYDKHLVFENNGVIRKQKLSQMYESVDSVLISGEFIVVSDGVQGIQVWDKSKIGQAPRSVARPWGFDSKYSLWNSRFLLSVPGIVNEEQYHLLTVTDLGKPPSASPITIQLSPEFTVRGPIGISGGYFWALSASDAPGKQLFRFPIAGSANMVAVDVAPAHAFESDGKLRFQVTADRPLTSPVVVSLRTRPGSAREGIDYVKYEGSVTLTPAKPTAEVVVTVLQDQELESYESLILEIMGVSDGAWKKRLFTTGVIEGSGFRRLKDIPPPPSSAGTSVYLNDWVVTGQGVVAKSPVDGSSSAFFIYRNGGTSWERLHELGMVPTYDSSGRRIIDTLGNRIVVAVNRVQPNVMEAFTLIAVDLASNEVLKTADTLQRKAWLHPHGLVFPSLNYSSVITNLPFGNEGNTWTVNVAGGSGNYLRLNDSYLVRANSPNDYQLVNFSDGTVAGQFPPLDVDSESGGFILGLNRSSNGRCGVIVNNSGAGYPCHTFPLESGVTPEDAGELMDNGIAFCLKPYAQQSTYQAIDGNTGAVLTTVNTEHPGGSISAGSGMLAFSLPGNKTGLLETTPRLPVLRELQVTRTEGGDPSSWQLHLSETSSFPITVGISTTSAEVSPRTVRVTIPAGQSSVPFPMSVVDDNIPEQEAKIRLSVTLDGNGFNRTFDMGVTIPANDFKYLTKLEFAAEGTAISLHPSGIVFGDGISRGAAEIRYKKAVTLPVAGSTASFGHAVGLNKKHMVVGAPLRSYSADVKSPLLTSFVFVYHRKTGKLVSQYSDTTRGSAFGSVLHVNESRAFIGAPAISRGGVATGYAFGKTAPTRYKHPKANQKATRFGTAITSKGKSVWIGAPGDVRGKVFEYDVVSGKLRKTILPPAKVGGNFGQAIVVTGSTIAISAPNRRGSSAVFLFNMTNGKLLKTISTPFADGGLFGASLAVPDEGILAVGCPVSKFSPAGGVMLYDLKGTDYRLITMLLPPRKGSDPDSLQSWRNLGMAAGLSGADGILGVARSQSKNLLDVTEVRRTDDWPATPSVGLIDLKDILPSKTKTMAWTAAAPDAESDNPWEKALGSGATDETCKLVIQGDKTGMSLRLPEIPSLAPEAQLILERSDDLDNWIPVAVLENGGKDGWRLLEETGGFILGPASLPIPAGERTMFYRIRCQAP